MNVSMTDQDAVSINDELKAFLEGPVSVLVGTRDAGLVPEITRAWGPQVSDNHKWVSLCVPLATVRKTLDNLEGNGAIAVAFCLPANYRTIQLKGRRAMVAEPDRADLAAVERHRDAFALVNESLGVTREQVEAFWQAETETSPLLVKILFAPQQIFDQTPGPGAGRSL
jgi:Pyridoxamine 5'-phosphate oxidase